jgi:hypothetical protein
LSGTRHSQRSECSSKQRTNDFLTHHDVSFRSSVQSSTIVGVKSGNDLRPDDLRPYDSRTLCPGRPSDNACFFDRTRKHLSRRSTDVSEAGV